MYESGIRVMPLFSKNEIRKAGHVFVAREIDEEDLADALVKVDYWRGVHVEILGRLLDEVERLSRIFPGLLVAGRLKKRKTIIDKLQREDNVKDLDTMYDIAGCRIVVGSLAELRQIADIALESPFCDKKHTKDYIAQPKEDGYRGIHVIYRYDDLDCGHTLRAELQIRTEREHAWATAVEMYDAAARTRLKFENEDSAPFWFFKKASALIEDIEMGRAVDVDNIRSIGMGVLCGQDVLDVVDLLREANNAAYYAGVNYALSIDDYCLIDLNVNEQMLFATRLESDSAVRTYFEAESESDDHDVVLTKGFSMEDLRRLYPNYFGNIEVFIQFVEEHMECFR